MGEVGRLYGLQTGTVCSLDTPVMSFFVGLLVNMPGLVNKCKENLEGKLVMEKRLVKIWQTGQLIWPGWWPGSNATPERVCV